MSTPAEGHESQSSSSPYFTDAESVAEMARLTRQAQMLSKQIGLLPPQIILPNAPAILDIACGPGEWVLSMARHVPEGQVTGIDISNVMIEYARSRAQEESLHNAHFHCMDALSLPLAFPEASFDLIYARFIVGFMRTTNWSPLLHECYRLLRPGGVLCHTELDDLGLSTSAALTRFNSLAIKAARLSGQCFTEEGDFLGATAVQAHLFQEAGFQRIGQQAHSVNFSASAPAHQDIYEDRRAIMKMFHPFIVGAGIAPQEEVEQIYQRALEEMRSNSFCAVIYYQTTWGEKPV
jgi:ubiquinone/menaquinone biosynthesis C-methylase UbiE